MQVGGKPVDFLIDTRATFSVLQQAEGPVSKERTPIQGATGKTKSYPWTQARITNLGAGTVTHSFLVMPECPYPLLGWDLLSELQATISFQGEGAKVAFNARPDTVLLTCPLSEEFLLTEDPGETMLAQSTSLLQELQQKIPGVWAESNPPGLATHRPPIVVQLTSTAVPIRVKQYPISQRSGRASQYI